MANLHDRSSKEIVGLTGVAVVALVCSLLGLWQLDRAEQKRQIMQRQQAQRDAPPVVLRGDLPAPELDAERLEYAAVELTGNWLKHREILLDNRVHSGRNGCHVLTPLKITGSNQVVLVNRGWVGWGPDRAVLPKTTARTEELTVIGRIALISDAAFTLAKETQDASDGRWPVLWQNLDLSRYESLLGREAPPLELLPFVVKMDANPVGVDGDGKVADPDDDGYVRDWFEPTDLWIARHTAYAVQWFGLGLTAVGLYWYRRRKRRSRSLTT